MEKECISLEYIIIELTSKILDFRFRANHSCSLEDSESAQRPMVINDFDVDSVWDDLSFSFKFAVFTLEVLGEAELLAGNNELSAGELELGSPQGFLGVLYVGLVHSD